MANISTSTHGRVSFIRVQGRFDYRMVDDFRKSSRTLAAAPGPEEIEVDLGGVDYIDSAALSCLLTLRDTSRMNNKTVVLSGISGDVAQVLSIANFSRLFDYR
jgi:anti-anti-sigma factor